MLKRLKTLARPDLRRFALRMTLVWGGVGAVIALLWGYYASPPSLSLWPNALAIIGFIYAVVAWFFYLALDNFSPLSALKLWNKSERRPSDRDGGILEHIEEPPDGGEMDRDDRNICCFAAFLLLAALMQIPSLAAALL